MHHHSLFVNIFFIFENNRYCELFKGNYCIGFVGYEKGQSLEALIRDFIKGESVNGIVGIKFSLI